MPQTRYDKQREKRPAPVVSLAGIRIRLGMTQREVCEKVSLILGKSFTVGALSALEKGHRGASPETLSAIQVALGLRPGDLTVPYEPSHSRRKQIEEDAA